MAVLQESVATGQRLYRPTPGVSDEYWKQHWSLEALGTEAAIHASV